MTDAQFTAGAPLSPEQQAFLTAQAAQQAASESAEISQAQAATADVIAAGQRGPLLPAEEQIDQLMAQLRAQSEQLAQMGAALTSVQRQMDEAQAATGGPLTVRYAQGAADKLAAMAVQYPNQAAGTKHFEPAHDAAAALLDAAKAVTKGGPLAEVENAAAAVRKFITRTHKRLGGVHVDWSAIIDDVELAVEEAAKLAAVA